MYAHRIAAAVVVACGAGLLVGSPSSAATIADPCAGMTIRDVVVSGDAWLAQCSEWTEKTTTDGGQTWRAPSSRFGGNGRPGADGRGNFFSASGISGGGIVNRLNGVTGVVESFRIVGASFGGWLAVDPSGGLWAPNQCSAGTAGLVKIDLTTKTSTLVASGPCSASAAFAGEQPLRVDDNGRPYLLDGPDSKLVLAGNQLVAAPLPPISVSGGAALTEGGVTGAGWEYLNEGRAIAGEPNFVSTSRSVGLVRRIGDSGAWAPTGRAFATVTNRGVLLPTADGKHLELVSGPLAAALDVSDPQPPDSAEMLDEGNRMRAEVGLPPLLGDALIAKAARNHADYLKLNNVSGHGEAPGTPGFTGGSPAERCSAVGVTCNGEVAYGGTIGRDAVQGWIATVFHRSWFAWPDASIRVGGGFNDRFAIMDAAWNRHFIGAPFGYPRDTYSGPLSFSGEIPDPGSRGYCPQGSVSKPYGTAITIALPDSDSWDREADAIQLRERGKTAPLAGCLMEYDDFYMEGYAAFLPDDPLKPGTTYDVAASWSGRHPDLSWSFTTTGARDDGPNRATPGKKRLRIKVAKRGSNRLRVDANPDGPRVSYRAVLQRRVKSRWRTVRTLKLKAPKHAKTLRTKPGAYRFIAPKQAGLKGAKSRVVKINKVK